METPTHILLFSGKRKSGKDFICEKLKSITGEDNCCIVRISGPLKQLFAQNHNLQINELMSDGPYKEQHRLNMITWSDEIRKRDPGYFCRAACKSAPARKLWIVSDIRRKTDIKWFKGNYSNLKLIRISADLKIRKERGWIFTTGVDDAESECDLDDFNSWDMEMANNNHEDYQNVISAILKLISS